MKLIPQRDPGLTRVIAREARTTKWYDVKAVTRDVGRGVLAFLRYIGELWERRHLVPVLASRDLKGAYEMNIVGFGWWLLEPLSMTAVYFVLINILRGGTGPGGPPRLLMILVALLPFKWFMQSLVGSMGIIRANANLINDVYLPRALLPITQLLIGLAHFGMGLLIVPIFMAILGVAPTFKLLWLPVIVGVQFILMLGIAYIFAVWGLNYRNLPGLMQNLLRLWFYLSPGLYVLHDFVPRQFWLLMQLNPLTGLFEAYRSVIVPNHHELEKVASGIVPPHAHPDWTLLYTLVVGLVLVVIGGFYFTRREPHFGKML